MAALTAAVVGVLGLLGPGAAPVAAQAAPGCPPRGWHTEGAAYVVDARLESFRAVPAPEPTWDARVHVEDVVAGSPPPGPTLDLRVTGRLPDGWSVHRLFVRDGGEVVMGDGSGPCPVFTEVSVAWPASWEAAWRTPVWVRVAGALGGGALTCLAWWALARRRERRRPSVPAGLDL